MEDQTIFEIPSSLNIVHLLAAKEIEKGVEIKTILNNEEFIESERELRDAISKGKLKSEPLSYFVMTINMNGKSLGKGSADNRMLLLTIILRNFGSSVIFAQEVLAPRKLDNLIETLNRDLDPRGKIQYLKGIISRSCGARGTLCCLRTQKESAIIWNNLEFSATDKNLKSSDRRIIRIRDELVRKDFQVSSILSRIKMVKLTRRQKEDKKIHAFLAVSCHGRHHGYDNSAKKAEFKGLQQLVKEVCKLEGNIPFIIGGDFNLDTTESSAVDDVVIPSYELSPRGEASSKSSNSYIPYKDNFLFSKKDISVKWIRALDVTSREEESRAGCDLSSEEVKEVNQIPTDPQRGVVDDLVDHDAVVGVLQLVRSVVKNLHSKFKKLEL